MSADFQINVLAELESMGWRHQPAGGDHIKALCPFHHEETPSCSVNLATGMFQCKVPSCAKSGDFITFLAGALRTTRAVIHEDVAKRYGIAAKVKVVDPGVVDRAHAAIWNESGAHLRKELYKRGVTDDDIRKHKLGVAESRVYIPIKSDAGLWVNVRKYLPGAPGNMKMRNMRGRGEMRLYPLEQLEYPTVVICGGEVKAIVAARLLNPHGIGAVCASGGEGNWKHTLTPKLAGKKIYVMMDVDDAGTAAANKLAAMVVRVATWVGIVKLPLDKDKHPKGDVNNFVVDENGDLPRLIAETEQWAPPIKVIDPEEEPTLVKFGETIQSRNVGKRMKFQGVIAAVREQCFLVPKQITVECPKNNEYCASCAVLPEPSKVFTISPESPAILDMVRTQKTHLDAAIRAALGIPKKCPDVKFEVTDNFNVEDVRLNPTLEITNRDNSRTLQQAFCVQHEVELNENYDMIGRLYPHPQTQEATLLLSRSEPTHDALSTYQPRNLHELRLFRPDDDSLEALRARFRDIYQDLSANVTRIYLRDDIHLFVDLAYHSPMLLDLDGKTVNGWVEVLIVGDSSNGKTDVTKYLMQHYQLGEKSECKNASVPGLLGGLNQLSGEWYVTWGVIPSNDKRLIVLEEMKGMKVDVIAGLTDMRSSGMAELTKIKKRKTRARTRIIGLSNPRGERKTISSYTHGIEAVLDLVGAPEDVRRFDAALITSSADIDMAGRRQLEREPPRVKHVYTSERCRELILWAWTRTPDQVKVDDAARSLISDEAFALTQEYDDSIPLVDRGSMRNKLLKLSASVACRVFSTGEDETHVRIKLEHVQFVAETLRRVYNSNACGYNHYSKMVRVTSTLRNPTLLENMIFEKPNAEELRDDILNKPDIDIVDVTYWLGGDRFLAMKFMSLLTANRAIIRVRSSGTYCKTPEYIRLLRAMDFSKHANRLPPAHLRDDEKF